MPRSPKWESSRFERPAELLCGSWCTGPFRLKLRFKNAGWHRGSNKLRISRVTDGGTRDFVSTQYMAVDGDIYE